MVFLKTFLMRMGILATCLVCACAGSHRGQVATPLHQKNLKLKELGKDWEDPSQANEGKSEPFTFEQDEPNIYM